MLITTEERTRLDQFKQTAAQEQHDLLEQNMFGSMGQPVTPWTPPAYSPPPQRITDGLGHHWDEALQGWVNTNNGTPYQESQSQPEPFYFDTQEQLDQANIYGEQGGFQFGPQPYNEPVYGLPSNMRDAMATHEILEGNMLGSQAGWSPPIDYAQLAAEDQMFTDANRPFALGDAQRTLSQSGGYTPDEAYALSDNEALRRAGAVTDTRQTFIDRATDPRGIESWLSGRQFQEDLGIDTGYMDAIGGFNPGGIPIGKAAEFGVDALTSPATWLTAGVGGAVAKGGLAGAAKIVGREAAAGAAGSFAYEALPEDTNPFLKFGAAIAAGGLGYGTPEVVRGLGKGVGALDRGLSGIQVPDSVNRYLADETGSVYLPGRSDIAKVTPGAFSVGQDVAETGTRVGSLLRPRGAEQLGDYSVKDVLKVASDLDRQTGSVANTLAAEAEAPLSVLGKTFKDENGNVYFKGIAPSETEVRLGLPGALATRVIERPGEYLLTPAQAKAADQLGSIASRVANERELFGVPVNKLDLDEGEQYFWRTATKPSEAVQAQTLVDEGVKNAGLAPKGAGSRLSIGKDKHRIYDDPAEAVAAGVVYADPRTAIREGVERGLSKAANQHVKSLLTPFAQTAADRVPPEIREQVARLRAKVDSMKGKLDTAERRAGTATGKASELKTPLSTLRKGVTPAPEAKAALKQAKADLADARRTALSNARNAGGTAAQKKAAQAQLDRLVKRAETIEAQLEAAAAKMPTRPDVRVDGLGRMWTDVKGFAEQAKAVQDQLDAITARGMRLPVGQAAADAADASLLDEIAGIKAGDTAGRLKTAEGEVIDAAKDVAPDEVYLAMRQMQKRADALAARGDRWSGLADSIQSTLADTQRQLDEILPKWKDVQEQAHQVPPGRSSVPQEYAPALIGSDFSEDAAKRITSYYSRGHVPPNSVGKSLNAIKVFNRAIVPVNSIGDASVTFNQLVMAGATHPVAFIKNFVKVARDMVADGPYYAWLSGPEAKRATPWVTLLGESGSKADYQVGSWIEKVPLLKQTQKHFLRFGNRMRVDAFNAAVDVAAKRGKPLDDLGKEQAGRAVNRLTGIPGTRATDIETLIEFAPNWLRANIENAGYAATDGTLEGQLARQYVKNYVSLGSALVVGVAMAQNRDLRDVVTPLDPKAMKRGEIRLNPNFMTVRVAGQDVSVFGTYDSLARLVLLAADAGNRAFQEQDARELFDFVGYATATKGGPLTKFLTDLIKDETFSGADPTSLEASVGRVLPFTAQGVWEGIREGDAPGAIAKDAAFGFFGAKSNPVSPSEQRDLNLGQTTEFDQYRKDPAKPATWDNLSPAGKDAYEAKHGKAEPFSDEGKASEAATAELTAQQQASDTRLAKREINAEQWREDYSARKRDLFARKDEIYRNAGTFAGNDKVLDAYFAELDKANLPDGSLDWDRVEAYRASLPKSANDYIDANTGLGIMTPKVAEYRADMKKIDESGYWELSDQLWGYYSEAKGIPPGTSQADYWKEQHTQLVGYAEEALNAKYPDWRQKTPEAAFEMADNMLQSSKYQGRFNSELTKARQKWRKAHPEESSILAEWGIAGTGTEETIDRIKAANE